MSSHSSFKTSSSPSSAQDHSYTQPVDQAIGEVEKNRPQNESWGLIDLDAEGGGGHGIAPLTFLLEDLLGDLSQDEVVDGMGLMQDEDNGSGSSPPVELSMILEERKRRRSADLEEIVRDLGREGSEDLNLNTGPEGSDDLNLNLTSMGLKVVDVQEEADPLTQLFSPTNAEREPERGHQEKDTFSIRSSEDLGHDFSSEAALMASVLASPGPPPPPFPPPAPTAADHIDEEPLSPATVHSGHDFSSEAALMASVLASPGPPPPPFPPPAPTAADPIDEEPATTLNKTEEVKAKKLQLKASDPLVVHTSGFGSGSVSHFGGAVMGAVEILASDTETKQQPGCGCVIV